MTNPRHTHRLRPLLLALLCAFGASAIARPAADAIETANADARSAYRDGQDAIAREDWSEAVERFRQVERSQRDAKEAADAAIYWQAYALTQAKRAEAAKSAVDKLLREYPKSAWADDARALVPARSPAETAAEQREEDALMAIDALLSSGSQRAVPILQKVLASNHSDKVKSRALFVLSQYDSEAADGALQSILSGNGSTKLKQEAIRMIAAGGKRSSLDRLLPLYRESTDPKIRSAVIDAWIIGSRGDLLRQAAATEPDARMRRRAIEAMGAVGDRKGLLELFGQAKDEETQRFVMQGLGIAGGVDELAQIAGSNASPKVRAEAIRAVGIAGGKRGAEQVVGWYASGDAQIRNAVIESLMISGESKQLVALYRAETDRDMKRRLLQAISSSGGDEALDLIDEMLEK
ncbi:MAG TPA: HEAT repeat domain-containing protein [Xanthomonadales bacterium]|nr:HEAT repeat domain-containing protein [Xanthomonadales bacterium]